VIAVFAVFFITSCVHDPGDVDELSLRKRLTETSPTGSLDYYVMPSETDYAALPNQDPANPITAEKVRLGQLLYYETGLAQIPLKPSSYETYSCSSCHIPEKGFLPGRMQGIADGAYGFGLEGEFREMRDDYIESELDAQGTRPLTSLNVAYVTNTLWSGIFGAKDINLGTNTWWDGLAAVNYTGYVGLEAQNIEGFDLHRLEINDKVLDVFGYRALFDEAFADRDVSDRYNPETASFAMSAYTRTMLTNQAPYQEWLRGDPTAITAEQKRGAYLFYGKARCYNCHSGPSFSSMNFHALGTKDMYEFGGLNTSADDERNLGRGMFTGRPADMHRFKVPQLYNLKQYETFFHGSSKLSIREVVDFKMKAQSENSTVANENLSPLFKPVDLTEEEINNLIDFLENALFDPNTTRYVPDAILSGYCFPNNDIQARKDMGCE
jgi:cytochrome c peroxidase